MTIPRIEEPSPPGVSRTRTTASYPPSSARSTAFSTYSCVTGLMSLSRWTARTRGASSCAENARRGRERPESEREGEKSPQTAAWHRCKDSISGGSRPLPAKDGRATLDPRAPIPRPHPRLRLSPRSRRTERIRLERGGRHDGRAPLERARPLRPPSSDAAVHARRGLLARLREPVEFRTRVRRRPLERMAAGQLPRPRTARTPARRSGGAAAGGSATRGGPAPPTGIEARASRRRVDGVRAHLVWSPATTRAAQGPRSDGGAADRSRARRGGRTSRSAAARRATRADVRFAIVHHTAGRNDYTRAQAAAIVRGIQLFHVQGNGWNDIGYNFLVDRFGTIYEGRFGGVDRNVIGAHALGLQHRLGGDRAARDVRRARRRRPPPRTRSRDSSPGGSISPTSIRPRPSRSSRAEASATQRTPRSRSARSRAIATRARPSARGTRSTRGSARSPPPRARSEGEDLRAEGDATGIVDPRSGRASRSHSRGRSP